MLERERILKEVRAAFEHEPRINLHRFPIQMDWSDETLTLEGEVENIAAKKLGMELAAAIPGIGGIVDRLHVVPATPMGDGAILDAVSDLLIQEPLLQSCTIRAKAKGKVKTSREGYPESRGVIEVSVNDGVVLLDDHVPSLMKKRLAGVLAWWVPGSRDVVNGMAVEPPEEDSDEEITEAVRLVLKKNPLVNGDQIAVNTRNAVVTLEGLALNKTQKHIAEFDAWYVFGVNKVVNTLQVQE